MLSPPIVQTTKELPRWERRKDARPAELLAAALELFVERGYAGTRLDDVAARAGVSKGTLYLYYTNKEELLKAVVRENIVTYIHQFAETAETYTGTAEQLIRQLVMQWWEHIGNTKLSGICKLIMAESGNFPELSEFYFKEVIQPAWEMERKILERGMVSGEFIARAADQIEYFPRILFAPMMMLAMWQHSFGCCAGAAAAVTEPRRYLEQMLDLFFYGLRTQSDSF